MPSGADDSRGNQPQSTPEARRSVQHESPSRETHRPAPHQQNAGNLHPRTRPQSPSLTLPAKTEPDTPPDGDGQVPSASRCDRQAAISTRTGCKKLIARQKSISAAMEGQHHSTSNKPKRKSNPPGQITHQPVSSDTGAIKTTTTSDINIATTHSLRQKLPIGTSR